MTAHPRVFLYAAPIAALATLIILAGCTAEAPTASQPTVAAEPAPVANEPPPAPLPMLSDVETGTVIARGDFTEGSATVGRIEILANGSDHGFDIVIADLSLQLPPDVTIEFSAVPPAATGAEYREGFSYYRYDELQPIATQTITTPGTGYGGFDTDDPTYMRTAVLWARDVSGGPFSEILATAPLVWELIDMRPGFTLTDNGPTEYAAGDVTLGDDGVPQSYQIAAGDVMDVIATRFDITVDDILWLNPNLQGSRVPKAHTSLNLDRNLRGL